jgi:general secretion pathway protein I
MRQQGFSLLEVLVAFSILALSLGVLMQIFSDAARNADLAGDQAKATYLAQSLLTSIQGEWPLEAGERSDTFDHRFRWQARIAPYEDDGSGSRLGVAETMATVDLWEMSVRVAWGGGTGLAERSVVLSTLRARPRPPR